MDWTHYLFQCILTLRRVLYGLDALPLPVLSSMYSPDYDHAYPYFEASVVWTGRITSPSALFHV